MSVIKNVFTRGLSVLLGVVFLALIVLTFWFEAGVIYGVALHFTPVAYAVILDIILLFVFYCVDLVLFTVLLALSFAFLFD